MESLEEKSVPAISNFTLDDVNVQNANLFIDHRFWTTKEGDVRVATVVPGNILLARDPRSRSL